MTNIPQLTLSIFKHRQTIRAISLIRILFLTILLGACNNAVEQQAEIKKAKIPAGFAIPQAILNANLPGACLQAWVRIDGGQREILSISNQAATFSRVMTAGKHSIILGYDCIGQTFSEDKVVPLASITFNITLVSGDNNIEFNEDNFQFFDSDNDGILNVKEVERRSNPFLADSNSPPVANAGTNQAVTLNKLVTLDGSSSNDFDRDSLSYAWTMKIKPLDSAVTTISNGSQVKPTFIPDAEGDYIFSLSVNDGIDDSLEDDDVTISAGLGDLPPVADAGQGKTVIVNKLVTLNGSGSSDVNADPLTYQWTMISSPVDSTASLTDANSVTPKFTPDKLGVYEFTLVVNDGTSD
ncbi:MAG: PKD domain-containing protein, partial [Thiohalomonadales bacterium]